MRYPARLVSAVIAVTILLAAPVAAQEVKHYRFAYDQPRNTGYSIAGDLFADKLKELSKGTMIVDQYPGAQLARSRSSCNSSRPATSSSQSFLRPIPRPFRRRPVSCRCTSCFATKST